MQTITAAELLNRLANGQHTLNRTCVTGDFVWDSVTRGDLTIDGSLYLAEMHFQGKFDLGDLTVKGDIFLAGSTFDCRCSLYRTRAKMLSTQSATFTHGLGIVNSEFDVADLMHTSFPGDALQPPCGLLVKKTTGQLLRLDQVRSASTVIVDSPFDSVTEQGAELGRRTATTLGEVMAA